MAAEALGRVVLVPVVNPASARPLLVCAARIAAPDEGRVEMVTVLGPEATADEHAHAWQGLAEAEDEARRLGAEARGRVVLAADPAAGVLGAIDERDVSLVVMGWRGASSTTNVFGRLIDSVVGRSTVPLALVRLGTVPFEHVLFPVSPDHLLPGGRSSLHLGAGLVRRLAATASEPVTLLRTGELGLALPTSITALADRIHHDPRPLDRAVGAFARAEDLIVAAVAPTVSGLRDATTHLAWSAPEATLLVAIDVVATREAGLEGAVEAAGQPAPRAMPIPVHEVRIVVTARLTVEKPIPPTTFERLLQQVGRTDHVSQWWPAADPRPHVRATVTVEAKDTNDAIGTVMVAVHETAELSGAEISYEVDRGSPADLDG